MSKKVTEKGGQKIGLIGLSALVFGMMVGAGIFNIPQNMAASAGLPGVVISWVVTAAGMLLLVLTFKRLADHHPELDAGIYQYARKGFGPFSGFITGWGYWLCTAFSNVAYAVMLNDTFGAFFPRLLHHGWPTVIFISVLIWAFYFIVGAGIKTAKMLTTALSVVKISAIVAILLMLWLVIDKGMLSAAFSTDFSVTGTGLGTQVKDSMMVTLWCFIGIEGAVIMSGRAKRSSDIGKAGIIGFVTAWLLYLGMSVLSFGLMPQNELRELTDPSVAYLLRDAYGSWAYYGVIWAVIISLLGGWVAWTLVCAEVPYSAAKARILPHSFLKLNKREMPMLGLFVSSIAMELFAFLILMADDVYLFALNIIGLMILPAYLVSGLFLVKTAIKEKDRGGMVVGILCSLFCLWMLYAGGLELLMETSLFYLLGLGFHFKARKEYGLKKLTRSERWGLLLLACASIASLILLLRH